MEDNKANKVVSDYSNVTIKLIWWCVRYNAGSGHTIGKAIFGFCLDYYKLKANYINYPGGLCFHFQGDGQSGKKRITLYKKTLSF